MSLVLIALLPATIFGVINFGIDALKVIVLSVTGSVLTEYVYEKLMHKKVTVDDRSAEVTGLLLALNLPASAPWYLPVLGSVFAACSHESRRERECFKPVSRKNSRNDR